MTIWELYNSIGDTISFHPTKKVAEAELKWWQERDSDETFSLRPVTYRPTREGVCQLLNAVSGT